MKRSITTVQQAEIFGRRIAEFAIDLNDRSSSFAAMLANWQECERVTFDAGLRIIAVATYTRAIY